MSVIIPTIPNDAARYLNYTRPLNLTGGRGVTGTIKPAFKADSDFWIYKVGVTQGGRKK